jgi:hypothetical protein
MPRYYFHFLDKSTGKLVRDSAGTCLPDASEVQREAVGLAQDIVRHRLHGSAWQVLVTDQNANVVLTLSLSKVQLSRIRALFDLVRHATLYEPGLRPDIFTWLLAAVVLALIIQSAMLRSLSLR